LKNIHIIDILTVNAPWVDLVQSCLETSEVDERIKILQRINRLLPVQDMIKLPNFITNDYIDKTLDLLEERLNSHSKLKTDVI
jgi:hypothetical protein